jgi:adenine-specific DNA-methyltransferase
VKESLPVLTEDKTKEIVKDHSKPTNFIFEGDNYHTLYTLNFTHKRKIDTIYIDPPYNTGNKSWRYNNDYIDKEDRFRHSKWLSFMSKRLRLLEDF